MQKMDINENGLISFDEFMASLHPDLLDYEKIVIAYSYLQKEGKWISSDDLANLTNSPEDIGI